MPNHSRKRRAARAKARKNSNSVESPLDPSGMSSFADIPSEESNEQINQLDLKTEDSKTDFKFEENKFDLKTEESKSDLKVEESKLDLKTEESKFDLKNEESKFDLKTEENKFDLKTEENKFDLKTEENKFDLKTEETKVDLKTEETKVDLKTEETKVDLKTDESILDLKIEESKFDLNTEESKPDLKTEESILDLKTEKKKMDLKTEKKKADLKTEKKKADLKTEKKKFDLKTEKNKHDSKTEKGKKGSKNKIPFIYNEEKLSDEAILEKMDKAAEAAGEPDGPGCILKLKYNSPDEKPTPVVLTPEDITFDQSGGVTKIVLKEGTGDEYPGCGDRVYIAYDGYILNGKEKELFDTNRHKIEGTDFILGKGDVIKGWELGVSTMKIGEKSYFIMRPEYCYGTGFPPPPNVSPHATLLFEIELLDLKLEDLTSKKDGGILRKVLENGDGPSFPNEGSLAKVKLLGKYNGQVFEDCVKEFQLGEGICSNIPEGIELALYKFQLKEKSRIHLKDKYAFEMGVEEFGIPPMAPITYEVTLLYFEKVKDIWEMNTDEKYEKAKLSKEKGIAFIKSKNYKVALRHFRWIMTCLEKEPGADPETLDSRNSLLLSGYLNIALCCTKVEGYKEAIKFCDKALKMDPKNEKALYRRGEAKMMISDCSEALEDFKNLLSIYPENKAAIKLMAGCREKLKFQQLKDKSVYSKMFDKFVKQDQERMKNMKTETGVWQEGSSEVETRQLSEAERLIEQNDSLLRAANIIELSNTVCEKL